MEPTNNSIHCPNCNTEINVSEILFQQVQDQLQKDFDRRLAEKEKVIATGKAEIEQAMAELTRDKENLNLQIEHAVKSKLTIEKEKLELHISQKLKEETAESMQQMQKELTEKSTQLKELHQAKIDVERLKREKEEMREALLLEKEKEFSEKLALEKRKIQQQADETSRQLVQTQQQIEQIQREKNQLHETIALEKERELTIKLQAEAQRIKQQVEEENAQRISELNKQLNDQKALAEEMKRKAEQGSMQLQGEVQEIAIEEWLRTQFPLDTIEEIKKGQLGADCVQTVHTRNRTNLGKICYESKNTKAFGGDWITKLKNDALLANASVAVLVTQVYPRNVDRMSLIDGVWVCSFDEFKGLCTVLREGIIQVSNAMATQENKGDKMVMLYNFLTGNEFRAQVEAIVDGFTSMKASLQKERIVAQRNFNEREKQIEKVLLNTAGMYGSIKGIAGNAVQDIKMLGDEDDITPVQS